jgi:hypothetical protein
MSRRHPSDLSGAFLESNRDLPKKDRWHEVKFLAIQPNGRALWPERFPLAKLRQIRAELEAEGKGHLWHGLYQQDPIGASESRVFAAEWFTEGMFCEQDFDAHSVLAISTAQKPGDYYAVCLLRFSGAGEIFVAETYLDRDSPDVAIAAAIRIIAENPGIELVALEADAGAREFGRALREECAAKGIPCPAAYKTWTAGDGKIDSKYRQLRIKLALWPKLAKGKISLRESRPNRLLFRQLRDFGSDRDAGPNAIALGDLVLRQMLGRV